MDHALPARSKDGKDTPITRGFLENAGIHTMTVTLRSLVLHAWMSNPGTHPVTPTMCRDAGLVENKYLLADETVEFLTYRGALWLRIQLQAPHIPLRMRNRKLLIVPKGNLPVRTREQLHRLHLSQSQFEDQTLNLETDEHGRKRQLDRLIQIIGQTLMPTERLRRSGQQTILRLSNSVRSFTSAGGTPPLHR